MLPREHSAILSACIKLPIVIKTFVLSIYEWPFYTGFTVLVFNLCFGYSRCLIGTILLSTHNIYFGRELRKIIYDYAILSRIVSMIRKYHNQKLQTTPLHSEEEPLNHQETPGKQIKQSNQLSLPHQDDCNTRMDIQ